MHKKFAVISEVISQICDKLISEGYKLIYSQRVDGFISYEQKHADMQCLVIDDTVFVLKGCTILGEQLNLCGYNVVYTSDEYCGDYPDNIRLNAKVVGKNLICKYSAIDSAVKEYCIKNGYNIINTNQGYAACSCLKISNNAIITGDGSIYKALNGTGIDVLMINQENIRLIGAGENTHGFIGGASVNLCDDRVLFFGNITNLENYPEIVSFCTKHNTRIEQIKDMDLSDIGGSILLNF